MSALVTQLPLVSNEGNRGPIGQSCLPRSFSCRQAHGQCGRKGQAFALTESSRWPQVPIEAAGLLACPTQSAVLGAQAVCSAADGGIAFWAHPVSRAGCLRPGPKHFCIEATRRSGSKTVLFLSMK